MVDAGGGGEMVKDSRLVPPMPSLAQLNLRRDLWDLWLNTIGALIEITCQLELRAVDQSERSRAYRDGASALVMVVVVVVVSVAGSVAGRR